MDSSLRASAFAGLGAFVLSCIVAAFSRVTFGALLLRALLSGIAFAAVIYGAQFLLRRFLPEIFDAKEAAPPVQGSLVDIVVPGGEAEFVGPSGAVPEAQVAAPEAVQPLVSDAPGSGEIEREVADIRSERILSTDPGSAADNPSGGLAPNPAIALDTLDTLPDLEGMSSAFTEATPSGGDPGAETATQIGVSDTMPTAGAPRSGGGDQDPALLAKAVQTLLRRDQKGQ